jgi:hypothetical protein
MAELGLSTLTSAHREALVAKLNSWRWTGVNLNTGVTELLAEEGFDSAIATIFSALPPLPSYRDTKDCLEALEGIPADNVDPFWQLVRATKSFVAKHGVIPHYGVCPDMPATPELFKQRKDIYRAKSEEDLRELLADPAIVTPIDPAFATLFIRNIWRIGGYPFQRIGVSLEKPKTGYPYPLDDWNVEEYATDARLGVVRALFIATRRFLATSGRNPTLADKQAILEQVNAIGPVWKEAAECTEVWLQ